MKQLAKFPTPNFKHTVIDRDVSMNTEQAPDADTIVERYAGAQLPKEPRERQAALVKAYTDQSPIYGNINEALRDDDLRKLSYYGGYIKELRDAFKTDHVDQIITPFEGMVWRGIRYADVEKALRDYPPGKIFVWAGFNSFTTEKQVAESFGSGGVLFRVKCAPPPHTYDDDDPEYAPADIQEWSAFGTGEAEILFPCNIKLRVLQVLRPSAQNGLSRPEVWCRMEGLDTDGGVRDWFSPQSKYVSQLQEELDIQDLDIDEMKGKMKQIVEAQQDQMNMLSEQMSIMQGAGEDSRIDALQESLKEEKEKNQEYRAIVSNLQSTVANLQSVVSVLQLQMAQQNHIGQHPTGRVVTPALGVQPQVAAPNVQYQACTEPQVSI